MDRLGNVDSRSEYTNDFMNWDRHLSSDKLAVILWNHGWSWLPQPESPTHKGIMSDDATGTSLWHKGEFEDLTQCSQPTRAKFDILDWMPAPCKLGKLQQSPNPMLNFLLLQDYVNWEGWYDQFLRDSRWNPICPLLSWQNLLPFWQSGDSTISTIDLSYLLHSTRP